MSKADHCNLVHPWHGTMAGTVEHVSRAVQELQEQQAESECPPLVKDAKIKNKIKMRPCPPPPPVWSHHPWSAPCLSVYAVSCNSFRQVTKVYKAPGNQKCEKCPGTPPSWPPGAGYTGPTPPKFRCGPWISIYYHAPDSQSPVPAFTKVRNHCARGSPPKSRISGHVNSRLMRGASKQGQTKCLSYYMGEG